MNSSQYTSQTLAHELNSLLDGTMRWLHLAEQAAQSLPETVAGGRGQIIERHAAAKQGLERMAELISRAQGAGGIDPVEIEMLRSPRSIERELAHIVSLLTPECQSNGVELRCDVDPRAAQLEAGILAPVLMNGLRNAIESCCRPGLATRRVAVSIHLRTPRSLRLLIEDTGIGLPQSVIVGASPKGDGHGIGLALCRSLVDQSGGQLELSNVPYGGGAVLSVTVDPLALAHRGADAA